jgi:hypothetical protein
MEPWSQKCFYFPVSLHHPVYHNHILKLLLSLTDPLESEVVKIQNKTNINYKLSEFLEVFIFMLAYLGVI